jgi:hypothetical protein
MQVFAHGFRLAARRTATGFERILSRQSSDVREQTIMDVMNACVVG